jgi:hypothetical protein
MTRPGARAGPDGIDTELRGQVTGRGEVDSGERLGAVAHDRAFLAVVWQTSQS